MQHYQPQPQLHRPWWPSVSDRMPAGPTLSSSQVGITASSIGPGVPGTMQGTMGPILGTGHEPSMSAHNSAYPSYPGLHQSGGPAPNPTTQQQHAGHPDLELLELQSLLLDDTPTAYNTSATAQQPYAPLQAGTHHSVPPITTSMQNDMGAMAYIPAVVHSGAAPPSNEAGLRLLAHLKSGQGSIQDVAAQPAAYQSGQGFPVVPPPQQTTAAQPLGYQQAQPAYSNASQPSGSQCAAQQHLPLQQSRRHGVTWTGVADVLVDITSTAATPAGGVGSVFDRTEASTPFSVPGAAPHLDATAGTQPQPAGQQATNKHQHTGTGETDAAVMCCTAVFLTDTSRELLLSVIPPLHTHTAAYALQLQPAGLLHTDAALLPLGAQVTLQLTGIAADSSMQVVSVSCPEWLPPCHSPVPYLIISHAHDMPDQAHAERIVAEGVCGASSCYHALSDPLPLIGILGATANLHSTAEATRAQEHKTPVTLFSVDELQAAVVAELHRTQPIPASPAGATPAAKQHGRKRDAAATLVGTALSSATLPGSSVAAAHIDLTAASPAGSSVGRPSQIHSAGSAASLTALAGGQDAARTAGSLKQQSVDAGLSMQQKQNLTGQASRQISTESSRSRHSTSGAAVTTRASTPGPPSQDTQPYGGGPLAVAGGTNGAAGGRAVGGAGAAGSSWLSGLTNVADLSQLDAAAKEGSDVDEFELWMRQDERVLQGGMEAPAGAADSTPLMLASIRDDDSNSTAERPASTGGHDIRVTKLKDVNVGDLVEVTPLTASESQMCDMIAVGVVEEVVIDDPIQPHGVLVRLQDNTLGHTVRVRTRSFQQTQEAWPSLKSNSTSGVGAPTTVLSSFKATPSRMVVGGIKVLHKAKQNAAMSNGSKHTSIASSDGGDLLGGGVDGKTRRGQQGARGMSDAEVRDTWHGLQKEFGAAICNAVLADCDGSAGEMAALKEAIQVLQNQAQHIEQLGDLVARCVSRVEAKADAAAVAALQQQQQEDAERSGAGRQSLKGGRASSRGRFSTPGNASRSPVPSSPHRTGPAGSWAGGAPRPSSILQTAQPAPKLLRNAASVATHAAAAGLPVKDVEALVTHFPGLSPGQAVSLLQLANGSVSAAVDELMALGLVPGPPEAVDKQSHDYVCNMLGLEDSPALTPAQPLNPAGGATAPPAEKPRPAGGPWGDVEWETRLHQLMSGFEGVSRDAAEVALQACSGDVRAAACMLQDSVAAQAQVAKESDTAKVALQLAAEEAVAAKRAASPASRDTGKWQVVGSNGGAPPSGAVTGSGLRASRTATDTIKAKHKMSADKARSVAEVYYNARNLFFQQAAQAFACGDGKAAAEYSRKGREYAALAKQFRATANDEAYKAFNSSVMNTFTMDLHGMHVDEALQLLARQVDALGLVVVPDGASILLRVITGRGNHSIKNYAAIKHAVLDWLKQQRLAHFLEPGNEGCVIVHVPPNTRTQQAA